MQDNNPISASIAGLTVKVEAFKLIARNALRMNLISPRLSTIADITATIDEINKQKARLEHSMKVLNYEVSKLDSEHPDFEKIKEGKEVRIKELAERGTNLDKEVENLNKLIAEQKEGILKIESGETKVSLSELNNLVEELINEDARNQVKTA